jgi:hypothetical protein
MRLQFRRRIVRVRVLQERLRHPLRLQQRVELAVQPKKLIQQPRNRLLLLGKFLFRECHDPCSLR